MKVEEKEKREEKTFRWIFTHQDVFDFAPFASLLLPVVPLARPVPGLLQWQRVFL